MNVLEGPKMREILVVAAHPDDDVLGVGATIPRMRERGARVTVVVVTDGSSAQYPDSPHLAEAKTTELRLADQILGVDELVQWSFPDMRLDSVPHVELNAAFETLLSDGGFDTVFVHHPGDINLDHRRIYDSVSVAACPAPGRTLRSVLTYHVNSSTEWGRLAGGVIHRPTVYVDVTETLALKLEALSALATEVRPFPHPWSLRAVEAQARVWGAEVGVEAAEAFELVRHVDG